MNWYSNFLYKIAWKCPFKNNFNLGWNLYLSFQWIFGFMLCVHGSVRACIPSGSPVDYVCLNFNAMLMVHKAKNGIKLQNIRFKFTSFITFHLKLMCMCVLWISVNIYKYAYTRQLARVSQQMPAVLCKEMDQRIKISATNPSCSMDRKKIYERAYVIVVAIYTNFLFTLFTFRERVCCMPVVWVGLPYAIYFMHSSCYPIKVYAFLFIYIDNLHST